jgi:hypothetical protein
MLDVMISWTADLPHHVFAVHSSPSPTPTHTPTPGPATSDPVIPNPDGGEAPPFQNAVTTLLKWGMWGALLCCVAGFLIIGARMGLQHKRGEGGGHVGSMAIVGFATILIMSAYAIVHQIATST